MWQKCKGDTATTPDESSNLTTTIDEGTSSLLNRTDESTL